jgi:hypothetical protein
MVAFVLVGALGLMSRAAAPDPAAMKTLREGDAARAVVANALIAPAQVTPVRAIQARGSGVKEIPFQAPVNIAPATWKADRIANAVAVDESKPANAADDAAVAFAEASDFGSASAVKPLSDAEKEAAEQTKPDEPPPASRRTRQCRNVCVHLRDRRNAREHVNGNHAAHGCGHR